MLKAKRKVLRVEEKKIQSLIQKETLETKMKLTSFSKNFRQFRDIKMPTRKEFMKDIN